MLHMERIGHSFLLICFRLDQVLFDGQADVVVGRGVLFPPPNWDECSDFFTGRQREVKHLGVGRAMDVVKCAPNQDFVLSRCFLGLEGPEVLRAKQVGLIGVETETRARYLVGFAQKGGRFCVLGLF